MLIWLIYFGQSRNNNSKPLDFDGVKNVRRVIMNEIEQYSYKDTFLIRQILMRDGSMSESKVATTSDWEETIRPEDYDSEWLKSKDHPLAPKWKDEIRMVDLFSGTGPMTLGVVEAGRATGRKIKPVFAVDFEKTASDNYKLNFPDCEVVNDDINNIIDGQLGEFPTKIEQDTLSKLGKIDMVIGGPPCQGHSDLNNHTRRDDPRNQLIFKVIRFVELFSPKYVIIENVQGIRHDKHNVLGDAEAYLEKLGYTIKENLLLASNYGVAQNRRRFILVATKEKIDFDLSHYVREKINNVCWAIDDLSSLVPNSKDIFNTSAVHSKTNQERMNYLYDNGIYELPNHLRPKCQQKEDNRYTSVYGRMYPDKPGPTITSGFGSIGQGRFGHPYLRRTLTPHEAARVQFIPDFFKFGNSLTRVSLQKMIGNAVPPKLTYIIGLELLR